MYEVYMNVRIMNYYCTRKIKSKLALRSSSSTINSTIIIFIPTRKNKLISTKYHNFLFTLRFIL